MAMPLQKVSAMSVRGGVHPYMANSYVAASDQNYAPLILHTLNESLAMP